MKNGKIAFTIAFIVLILLGWALVKNISLYRENTGLKAALNQKNYLIEELQLQMSTLQLEKNEFQSVPSMTYCTYEFEKRLVMDQLELHIYPGNMAPKASRIVEPYTVITVLDSGFLEAEDRELWLYVTFPTYDTPMDSKGWIRESDTIALTEDNKAIVKNPIYLKKGTPTYEVDNIESITSDKQTELQEEVSARIVKEDSGYVLIHCGGGWSFWVEKERILYPTID